MADDESIFDPSLKKKKKKKKTPFDPSALEDGSAADVAQAENGIEKEDAEKENREDKDDDPSLDLDDFSGLKKKKKKKKPFSLEDMDAALPEAEPKEESLVVADEDRDEERDGAFDDDLDFNLPKKKKKKKKITFDAVDTESGAAGDDENDDTTFEDMDTKSSTTSSSNTWSGSDRDYTYDELLQRVFNIMREKNPDMVAGEKKKLVMRPPQVLKVGTKKSSFANFLEICKMLHRQPKHVQAFLLAELGTSGSVDANNQLIIKGRFQQKQIENVLRRYIKEYVTCHTCRSPDTILQKDTRLFFLQCEKCGSRCSVVSIKSGFQAVTGKRAAIRAKTA
ncbi:eukaryotic translation initiation factor 2 subunit beta isoform X3 [Rhipicephalus microplus]|uniref:eukaryotic translation initiation factor 2 subunit beta isoform X3 n=1 Tax=Rhipicephalus microplus TaxID=6941 RepID=UPI00188987E4|nr:eukaryotic translation initiation factor 2 subunit 2-like isoform X4 [Rhipicephalus microplus]